MNKLKTCFQLLLSFFKIGAFTFGGGYAMIPVIQHEAATKKKWVTEADILDIVAISESTPGPISVNAATFIGMRTAGVTGAAFATFGLILPSFLIILILSSVLELIAGYTAVIYAFFGIRAAVLGLILSAAFKMYKSCPKDVFAYIIGAAAFAVSLFTPVNVIIIVVCGGAVGFASFMIAHRKAKETAGKTQDVKAGGDETPAGTADSGGTADSAEAGDGAVTGDQGGSDAPDNGEKPGGEDGK